MSYYPICSHRRQVMSIPNLMASKSTPPATPEYHHQPYYPPSTVASDSFIHRPSIVVDDSPLYSPEDDPLAPSYPQMNPAIGSSKEYGHQPHEHRAEERRRRNKVASAKYRAKRNQENEYLRKWIDDLRRQNSVLVMALNDIHSQGNRSSGGKKPPLHGSTATSNGFAPHHWTASSWGTSAVAPF